MEMKTLKDLYVNELKDLWSAETQILKALPKMIEAATAGELKEGFAKHEKQTEEHARRLEEILESLAESPEGKKCVGMEGLLKEGADLIEEEPTPDVLDAGLISAAQHVEHYEIAGYGTVRTWAGLLGHQEHVEILQQTLVEEEETDETLSKLAESVNVSAEAQAEDA